MVIHVFSTESHFGVHMQILLQLINIIQSECWPPDISGVYDPITVKFCEKVSEENLLTRPIIYLPEQL